MRLGERLNTIALRFMSLCRRRRLDRDLEDELDFHLAMTVEQTGQPDEARRRFGNLSLTKERCRELWMLGAPEIWWQDFRHALRWLRSNPAFTVVAALTLAIAIGANTAIFSVVDAVLLRELPYRDAGRLAILWTTLPEIKILEGNTSVPNFEDWRSRSRSFSELAMYIPETAILRDPVSDEVEPEEIQNAWTTPTFFSLLGVPPALGRTFSEDESRRGDPLVVLSHGLWQHRFGGSATAIGQSIHLNGSLYQIVGVMPPGFRFPFQNEGLWTPAASGRNWWPASQIDRARSPGIVIGRLQAGATLDQVKSELTAIAGQLEQQYPVANRGRKATIVPLQVQLLGKTAPLTLWVLSGAVGFILLIACANVANLLLARSSVRDRELAVRSALGASRSRLIRQMLTEALTLALLGASLGLPLAVWGVRALAAYAPADFPRMDEVDIDLRVLSFTASISVLAALFFGLLPALRSASSETERVQRTARDRATGGRVRASLMIGEFALGLILLAGAGLLIRSLIAVRAVDPGLKAEGVLALSVNSRVSNFPDDAIERIQAIPGVQSAAAINDVFFRTRPQSMNVTTLVEVEGHPAEARDRWAPLVTTPNSGDFVKALGARLLAGRTFTAQDTEDAPLVVVVNRTMAQRFWPGEDPIGKRFRGYPGRNRDWVTVIGVAQDLRNVGLEHQAISQMFPAPKQYKPGGTLIVRTIGNPLDLSPSIRAAIRSVDKRAVISNVTTLKKQLDQQTAGRRFQSFLLGMLSLVALTLASVGIYGSVHYSVARRTREIGIRTALGASPSAVLRMILNEAMRFAAMGIAIGIAGAAVVTRGMSGLLFGVTPTDPVVFVLSTATLAGAALIACLIPAQRAARVDPTVALRYE